MGLLRLSDKRPDREIDKCINAVIADANVRWSPLTFEGEYPNSGYGITTLRPKDICYDGSTLTGTYGSSHSTIYWCFSLAAAGTWYSIVDLTLDEDNYITLEGVLSRMASPVLSAIQVTANGQDQPIINVEEMYTWDLARGWFSKPLWIQPKAPLVIRAVGSAASTAEQFGFLGHTIAKRARLIKR